MSQLIHMRQRIKTVETIKRITHAMRLVSRSSHFRLSKQQKTLAHYHQRIAVLFSKLRTLSTSWHNSTLTSAAISKNAHPLILLVGSHKELCGNFNSMLFDFFAKYMQKKRPLNASILSIGKKAEDFVHARYSHYAATAFIDRNPAAIASVAKTITEQIFSATTPYSSVIIVSNKIKSFFVHYPFITQLIPLTDHPIGEINDLSDIAFDHNLHDILDQLARMYITTSIQTALFESLVAEQAARFISMDNSTRNADIILESTNLAYNKLRQAKITKDLVELSSAF
jgi:F-type H+-transporting ATPase subunit gamma